MSKLLIIGNGFDRQIGLKSNFGDFWMSEKEKTFRDTHPKWQWNAWDILIDASSAEHQNWNDFETFIKEFLLDYKTFFKNKTTGMILKSEDELIEGPKILGPDNTLTESWYETFRLFFDEDVENQYNDPELDVYKRLVYNQNFSKDFIQSEDSRSILSELGDQYVMMGIMPNETSTGFSPENIVGFNLDGTTLAGNWNKEEFYAVMLNELKQWEIRFSSYINELTISSKDYKAKYKNLLQDIVGNGDEVQILDFNYTWIHGDSNKIVDKTEVTFKHIHGMAMDDNFIPEPVVSPIVIGFDYSDLDDELRTSNLMEFSKTFRILDYSTRWIQSEITSFKFPEQDLKLSGNNITSIIFNGHSLSSADDAYFKAIFDDLVLSMNEMMDKLILLRNGKVELMPCYCGTLKTMKSIEGTKVI